jgi:hypothetical protein
MWLAADVKLSVTVSVKAKLNVIMTGRLSVSVRIIVTGSLSMSASMSMSVRVDSTQGVLSPPIGMRNGSDMSMDLEIGIAALVPKVTEYGIPFNPP